MRRPSATPSVSRFAFARLAACGAATVLLGACGTQPAASEPSPSESPVPRIPASATPGTPPSRMWAAYAWDPKDQYVLLFGGQTGGGASATVFGDTWAWAGDGWLQFHPHTSPPARSGASLGYDASSRRMILYGGGWDFYSQTVDPARNDTWSWDGSTWTQLSPEHAPTTAACCASTDMAYDSGTRTLWLTSSLLQMWSWANGDWVLSPQSTRPPTREYFGFTYDIAAAGVVATCGYGGEGTPGFGEMAPSHTDTWIWKAGAWAELHPTMPAPDGACASTYDSAHGDLIALSSPDRLFKFDGTTWSSVQPQHVPPIQNGSSVALAYDANSHLVVLFGGASSAPGNAVTNQTWTWDGVDWTQRG